MKKNRSWKGILIIVLLLAIGFAAVTTTLYINGTIKFGANQKDFDDNLTFTAAKLEYSDTAKPAKVHGTDGVTLIQEGGKTIEFTVDPLTVPGETATLTYKIENKSQYNAKLRAIDCKVAKDVTTENPNGIDVTSDVLNGTKDDAGKYKEYIKLVPSATLDATLAAYNGVLDNNTITITMVKSYAGEAGVTPAEGEIEKKEYKVTCSIVADAESANAQTAAAGA